MTDVGERGSLALLALWGAGGLGALPARAEAQRDLVTELKALLQPA